MKIYSIKFNLLLLIALAICDILGITYIAHWREWFWQSVADKHLQQFIELLFYFSAAALLLCLTNSIGNYVQQRLALNWRRLLTRKCLKSLPELAANEGFRQRIQEDCRDYPLLLIMLIKVIAVSAIMIFIYSYLIIKQVGLLYLALPVAYALIATFIAGKIAKPLINLNYLNQVKEAAFRQILSRINYAKVHINNYQVFKKTKHLGYFQYFYNQVSVIIPYVLLAPIYFTALIAFGVLMQVASCINHLIDSMSIIINSFNDINKFLSCRKRLTEMGVI